MERLTLEKASIATSWLVVWSLRHYKSGAVLTFKTIDSVLFNVRFHTLTGVKKGDHSKGWTSERVAMATVATANVLGVAVMSGSLAAPGPVLTRAWLSSATDGSAKSRTVNHFPFTSTMVGRCQRRTAL